MFFTLDAIYACLLNNFQELNRVFRNEQCVALDVLYRTKHKLQIHFHSLLRIILYCKET